MEVRRGTGTSEYIAGVRRACVCVGDCCSTISADVRSKLMTSSDSKAWPVRVGVRARVGVRRYVVALVGLGVGVYFMGHLPAVDAGLFVSTLRLINVACFDAMVAP